MPLPDYYSILGLRAGASDKEVKTAYRKLSKRFHPDLNNGDKRFEAQFRAVHEAYDILIDPLSKAEYLRQLAWQNDAYSRQKEDNNTYAGTGNERYREQARPPNMQYGSKPNQGGRWVANLFYFGFLIFNLFVLSRSCSKDDSDEETYTYYRPFRTTYSYQEQSTTDPGFGATVSGDGFTGSPSADGSIVVGNPVTDSLEQVKIKKAGNSVTYQDTSSKEEIERWILGKFQKYCQGKVLRPNMRGYRLDTMYQRAKSYSFGFHGDAFTVKYVDQQDTARLVSLPVYNISIVVSLGHSLMFGQWYALSTETNLNNNSNITLKHFLIYFNSDDDEIARRISQAFRHLKKFYKTPDEYYIP